MREWLQPDRKRSSTDSDRCLKDSITSLTTSRKHLPNCRTKKISRRSCWSRFKAKAASSRRAENFCRAFKTFAEISRLSLSLMKFKPESAAPVKHSDMNTKGCHPISSPLRKGWAAVFRSERSSAKRALRSVFAGLPRHDIRREHACDGCGKCHVGDHF